MSTVLSIWFVIGLGLFIVWLSSPTSKKPSAADQGRDNPDFQRYVESMSKALAKASGKLAVTHIPCWYRMEDYHVVLKYYYSGNLTTEDIFSYSDLSGGRIYSLNSNEQRRMAGEYYYHLRAMLPAGVVIEQSGRGISLKEKRY